MIDPASAGVDQMCAPQTPYADAADGTPLKECTLCHDSGPFPANLPGKGNVNANGSLWDSRGGDASVFCPLASNRGNPALGRWRRRLVSLPLATDRSVDRLLKDAEGLRA